MHVVPIYDGRSDGFSLANFKNKLKCINREIEDESIVVVTFTLGSYPLREDCVPDEGPADLKTVLSFNIKDVILLADAVHGNSRMPLSQSELWGVNPFQMHPEHGDSMDEDEQDDVPPLEPMVEEV